MSARPFVHLHTHSEFSLLDGAARLEALVKQAVSLQMPAIALTDHGVMHGAIDFYQACLKNKIKPILGVEAYVAPRSLHDRCQVNGKYGYHMVLLARNSTGYHNLLEMMTIAATDGFYMKPRIDRELFAKHSEGIIATSACLGGEIPTLLLRGETDAAIEAAAFYRDLLGPEGFYLEVQRHGIAEQERVIPEIQRLSRELKIPIICTNDIHYLTHADAHAHDVLLCIGTTTTVDDPKRFRYESDQFFMRSADEMWRAFPDMPEALERTAAIADLCDLTLEFGRAPMPDPGLPNTSYTAQSYLEEIAWEGLNRKVASVTQEYRDRLAYELGVIQTTDFAQYFLVVRDFALFARAEQIVYGVRGSAAGSLVSYCVDITDIDPVEYGLTFERFLNPERVEMPDIDMDFEDTRRADVIRYVTSKYGEDRVAQIVTFGTLAAKAVIKDAGRALGFPLKEVNAIAALVPGYPAHMTIARAMEDSADFKAAAETNPMARTILETARRIEGISRHTSVHAAGVVISNERLVEYTPLQRSADGGRVTQYPASALGAIGLLKMDFLGLINLSILGRAVENIRRSGPPDFAIANIPLDDPESFALLGRGDTTGIFQLESPGMRRYVAELKPNSVRDLAAMIALYRPGPMAHIPTFIRAKHGQEPIVYPHERLETILKETYGVIVYQDQVLRIAQAIAGYSLGRADKLRKIMGKKIEAEMVKERPLFIQAAVKNGVRESDAVAIFNLIEPFSGYAFNKAHSVCYAMVAYQTAYLKAHFPVQYLAALLTCFVQKADKVATCLEECRRVGIQVLPPDVNRSEADFTPEGDAIRYGLAAVKNAGRAAVDLLLEARRAGGPFQSLADLCERSADTGGLGRTAIESLIQCGAMTELHPNRRQAAEALDACMRRAADLRRSRQKGLVSMFDDADDEVIAETPMPNVPDYPRDQILAFERDLLGFYITGHPLDDCRQLLARTGATRVVDLVERSNGDEVMVAGIISGLDIKSSRKSKELFAVLTLEDTSGSVTVTVFPSVYKTQQTRIGKDRIVTVRGRAQWRERVLDEEEGERTLEVMADEVTSLGGQAQRQQSRALHIAVRSEHKSHLRLLRAAFDNAAGAMPVWFHVSQGSTNWVILSECEVDLTDSLRSTVQRLMGAEGVWTE